MIKYKDLIELGFERDGGGDSVFFDEFGYEYFFLVKNLGKKHSTTWMPDERFVKLYQTDKQGNVLETMCVPAIESVKALIALYKSGKKSKNKGIAF